MSKVHITDVILRDAHQSLIATRMRTEDMLPVCEQLDRIGYWSLEVWGGATFDSLPAFSQGRPLGAPATAARGITEHTSADAAARPEPAWLPALFR